MDAEHYCEAEAEEAALHHVGTRLVTDLRANLGAVILMALGRWSVDDDERESHELVILNAIHLSACLRIAELEGFRRVQGS